MPRQIILLVINIFIKNGTSHNVDFFYVRSDFIIIIIRCVQMVSPKAFVSTTTAHSPTATPGASRTLPSAPDMSVPSVQPTNHSRLTAPSHLLVKSTHVYLRDAIRCRCSIQRVLSVWTMPVLSAWQTTTSQETSESRLAHTCVRTTNAI